MKRLFAVLAACMAIALLSSCSSGGDSSAGGAPTAGTSTAGTASDPKAAVTAQLDALKAGDVEKVKAGMTARVRDRFTAEDVEKAKGEAGQMTIDDLYDSVEMGEDDGKKTAKVKMKNGRTLTTLIEENGQWLADTVWFK
jgi:hypothetical protein